MSYEDYQSREWEVKKFEPLAKCTEGEIVTFEGPADQVIIKCNGRTPYGKATGEYKPESNTIERGDYRIHMMEGPPLQIEFSLQGSIGGSWTAEDNIADPGDGQP